MEGDAHNEPASTVGAVLRMWRLKSGYELGALASSLRIRRAFLEAIEEGDYDALPGPTYAVGFVRAYAESLGLDGEEVVRRFKRERLNAGDPNNFHFPSPVSEGGAPKTGLIFVGILISMLAYGLWYINTSGMVVLRDIVDPLPERLMQLLPGRSTSHELLEQAVPTASGAVGDLRSEPVENSDGADQVGSSQQFNGVGALPANGEGSLSRNRVRDERAAAIATRASESAAERDVEGGNAGSGSADPKVLDEASTLQPWRQAGSSNTGSAEPDVDQKDRAISQAQALSEPLEVHGSQASTSNGSSGILLRGIGETWIEVRDNTTNEIVFARLLRPNDVYEVPQGRDLRLLTGNAGGLEVIVDGEALRRLGPDGAVIRNIVLRPDALRQRHASGN